MRFTLMFVYFTLFIQSYIIKSTKGKQAETLIMVHVLCKHGDRTPLSSYPKDIYRNETYYPVGYGKLTNAGKLRSYNLGKYLRKRYDKLLGYVYLPRVLEVQSAPTARAKMSVLTLLSALLPPVIIQKWNNNLMWQPIPYESVPEKYDYMFFPQTSCNELQKIAKNSLIKDIQDGKFKEYQRLFDYLSHHTGKEIKTINDVYEIYDCLKCQKEWGLDLPSWSDNIYSGEMKRAAARTLDYLANTDKLKQLRAGFMLKKIINDTKQKIKKSANLRYRQMVIYSGHYANIVSMLSLLGVYKRQFPPYSSFILFEIYKRNGEHVVKVFYQDYTEKEPKRLKLPKCGYNCSLNKFVNYYKKYFATPDDC